MTESKILINDINILRDSLYKIIEQKGYELNDSEVLEASVILNTVIVNYDKQLLVMKNLAIAYE